MSVDTIHKLSEIIEIQKDVIDTLTKEIISQKTYLEAKQEKKTPHQYQHTNQHKTEAPKPNKPHCDRLYYQHPQWISCKDRLPSKDQKVLTYGKTGYYIDSSLGYTEGYNYPFFGNPTHWIPLPSPPESLIDKTALEHQQHNLE